MKPSFFLAAGIACLFIAGCGGGGGGNGGGASLRSGCRHRRRRGLRRGSDRGRALRELRGRRHRRATDAPEFEAQLRALKARSSQQQP
ncbi:hypothetical protein [Variovorax sp. SCN 67-20]|uniref:hypothetical protein n=1 Tax=Variovorax sp. SCN 67-20 TaxID=1660153 RepID=UPI0025E8A0F3|nr:hypothetical protein [Variovorax sp. SCN 67-20]